MEGISGRKLTFNWTSEITRRVGSTLESKCKRIRKRKREIVFKKYCVRGNLERYERS